MDQEQDEGVRINKTIQRMQRSVAEIRKDIKNYDGYLTLLEAVWDEVPAIMYIKDKNNNILRVNKFFCTICGGTKEEYENVNIDAFMEDKEVARKYAQNDLIIIKSNKSKVGILENLFDTDIKLRTDKHPIKLGNGERGVFGYSIIL